MSKIESILSQLTPDRVKSEIDAIQKVRLPAELQKLVKEYMKAGGRPAFIWKWVYFLLKKHTLFPMSKKLENQALLAKFSVVMINVLIDDLADKQKNKELLEKAISICNFQGVLQEGFSGHSIKFDDQEYIKVIREVWTSFSNTVQNLPRYKEFQDVLLFDFQQFFTSLRYGYLVNKNRNLVNHLENRLNSSHNMSIMIDGTIDSMASQDLDMNDLGPLREMLWRAQRMIRIGNSLATWKREYLENDFSSEVLSYVISKDIITLHDLQQSEKREIIQRIESANIEEYFLREWEQHYREIETFDKSVRSVNIANLLMGLEDNLVLSLCSVGYI